MTNEDAPSIEITIKMHLQQIDLNVRGEIAVEELVASLKRAGITHVICTESRGQRVPGGYDEELDLIAILPTTQQEQAQDPNLAYSAGTSGYHQDRSRVRKDIA